jgi:hypothetical protein
MFTVWYVLSFLYYKMHIFIHPFHKFMYKIYKSNAMVHKNHNHGKQNNVSQQLKLQPRNTKLPEQIPKSNR